MKTIRHPGVWPVVAALALLPAACGGGDKSDGGCEQVSAGSGQIVVHNDLAGGLHAFFPQLAFGADMVAGECDIVGFNGGGTGIDLRLEATQCSNSTSDSNCSGHLFGPTKVLTITIPNGESRSVTVNTATFARLAADKHNDEEN